MNKRRPLLYTGILAHLVIKKSLGVSCFFQTHNREFVGGIVCVVVRVLSGSILTVPQTSVKHEHPADIFVV